MACATPAAAQRGGELSADDLRDLRAQRAQIDTKINELGEANKVIATKQGEISNTRQSLGRLERASNEARQRVQSLQDIESKEPGSIQPEKLSAAMNENARAYRALADAKKRVGDLEGEVIDIRGSLVRQTAEFQDLRRSYEGRIDAATDRQVEERIRGMQVKKETQAVGRVSCESVTFTECRALSRKQAEQRASEAGSVVVIDSLTEVRNFKLSKEELRSVVSAQLSDVKELEARLVPDDPPSYVTRISATVTPAISPAFRQQLRGSVRSEIVARLGGEPDYARVGPLPGLVETPRDDSAGRDAIAARDAAAARAEAQRQALERERAKLEAEREQLRQRRAQEEAERIRRQQEEAAAAARRPRTFTPTF